MKTEQEYSELQEEYKNMSKVLAYLIQQHENKVEIPFIVLAQETDLQLKVSVNAEEQKVIVEVVE